MDSAVADQSDKPERRRLFFALWPDDATRVHLANLLHALPPGQGRDMRIENLHVTLVFIGDCDPEETTCLEAVGESTRGKPFELMLDHLGVFERAHVLWAGTRNPPEALLKMQAALVGQLATRCGMARDMRPYAPHLTLRRNTSQPVEWPGTLAAIAWRVDALALVESVPSALGVEYRPIRQWPLLSE